MCRHCAYLPAVVAEGQRHSHGSKTEGGEGRHPLQPQPADLRPTSVAAPSLHCPAQTGWCCSV